MCITYVTADLFSVLVCVGLLDDLRAYTRSKYHSPLSTRNQEKRFRNNTGWNKISEASKEQNEDIQTRPSEI